MKPSKPRVNARKFGDRNGGVLRGKAMPYFELRRGGAKGFYTIGVLKGLEGLLGAPLHKHFDLVYGTSTGSIIAALICLGKPIDEIHTLYKDHVVKVMGKWFPWTKSRALRVLAAEIFANTDFKSL